MALAAFHLISASAAELPVALIIDDVHRFDRSTRDVLVFIARRVGDNPFVVIGASRGVRTRAVAPVLDIPVLDEPSARRLLARHAATLPPAVRERILAEALGNPLALVELPTAWHPNGPPGSWTHPVSRALATAFAAGLAELPARTRDALLVAAVDHVGDLAEILAAASALAGHTVAVDFLDRAAEASLIRLDRTTVRFHHAHGARCAGPRARPAPATRRRRPSVGGTGAPPPAPRTGPRGRLSGTGDPRHLAALTEPVQYGRWPTGCRRATRCGISPMPTSLRLFGVAADEIGDPVRAVDLLARAEPVLREQGRLGLLADTLLTEAADLLLLGDWPRAVQLTKEARRILAENRRPAALAALIGTDALAAALRGQARRVMELVQRGPPPGRRVPGHGGQPSVPVRAGRRRRPDPRAGPGPAYLRPPRLQPFRKRCDRLNGGSGYGLLAYRFLSAAVGWIVPCRAWHGRVRLRQLAVGAASS